MKENNSLLLFLLLVFFCGSVSCKDFGIRGQTFPIEEESFLDFLARTLNAKDATQKMEKVRADLIENFQNPSPVKGLKETEKFRSFLVDPSFEVKKDIKDREGKVLVKAGTVINPLKQVSISSNLIFFDGSNEKHLVWARQQTGDCKWILVKGKPIELEEQEKRAVYFDQNGIYTSRFLIEHVPSRVSQKGNLLLIEEMVLEEKS